MSRLFTFGCSFTKANYPTWADILGSHYDYYENWGRPGAGNSFIFYSLVECIKRNKINSGDCVAIMWTSIGREDRYTRKKGWITPGTIYNQNVYDKKFVEEYADPAGYLIRDMAHLSAATLLLQAIGCTFYFFSIVPFSMFDDNINNKFDIDYQVSLLYNTELSLVKPSVYEVVFDNDWYSRNGAIDIDVVKDEYYAIQGKDWPSWQQFVLQEFSAIPSQVLYEINDIHNYAIQ